VRVGRRRQAQQLLEQHLPGRGLQQVLASDDLLDPRIRVVDHHRQVVRRHVVLPPQHEVVDFAFAQAVQAIVE
jgi:hypothetical protein